MIYTYVGGCVNGFLLLMNLRIDYAHRRFLYWAVGIVRVPVICIRVILVFSTFPFLCLEVTHGTNGITHHYSFIVIQKLIRYCFRFRWQFTSCYLNKSIIRSPSWLKRFLYSYIMRKKMLTQRDTRKNNIKLFISNKIK